MVNKVILLGNVGQDPTTKIFENNSNQLSTFSLATTKNWKDKTSGEKKSETQWHNLVAWSGLSKVVDKYVKKGSKIYVEGALSYRSYDDKEGIKRYVTEIVVTELKLLGEQKTTAATTNDAPTPEPANNTPAIDDETDDLPF